MTPQSPKETFSDDDLARLKELNESSDSTNFISWFDYSKTKALLARMEAAEACLLDVWHSSIDDEKLKAWRKTKGE